MNRIYIKQENCELPKQGTEKSIGYDIISTSEPIIKGGTAFAHGQSYYEIEYIEYETNIYISPDHTNIYTLIYPRSSISKYNLVLANSVGVIDTDYRGMLKCRFKYIIQPKDLWFPSSVLPEHEFDPQYKGPFVRMDYNKIYKKGDKIAQLIFNKQINIEFVTVNSLDVTSRNDGGFGSTDSKHKINTGSTPVRTPVSNILSLYENKIVNFVNTKSIKYETEMKEKVLKES